MAGNDIRSRSNHGFFCPEELGSEQIEMFDKVDMALYSANMFAWEADFSARTLSRTSLYDGDDRSWTFEEFLDCVHEDDQPAFRSAMLPDSGQERRKIDIDVRLKQGTFKWYKIKGKVYNLFSCGKIFAAGVAYDIDNLKSHLQRLDYLEKRDCLTGLNNVKTLDNFIEDAANCGIYPQAMMVANIDNLKEINDTLGYRAGNTLIKNVAQVLSECFFDAEMIARIGGGEYCAIFTGKSDFEMELKIDEANIMLHKMYLNLIKTEVTFGYAISTEEIDFTGLYRQAMNKMRRNKNLKKILLNRSVVDRLNEVISRKTGWGKRQVRLQSLSTQIGCALGCGEDYLNEIKALAKIADIGLIGIDDRLLKNRTKLGGKDRMDYMKHVEHGREILSGIVEFAEMENLYLDIYKRYDEWKEGLALSSRIVAGAMGFDDMVSSNTAVHFDAIKDLLSRQRGAQYCPNVVDAIIGVTSNHYA